MRRPNAGWVTWRKVAARDRLPVRASANAADLGVQDYVIVTLKAHSVPPVVGAMQPLIGPDTTITLDFNKAINPPCAFTDYAVCPLPPAENVMELLLLIVSSTLTQQLIMLKIRRLS